MTSEILITIQKEEFTPTNKTTILEYVSKDFVFVKKELQKDLLYCEKENKLYIVDFDRKLLLETSKKELLAKIAPLKKLLGDVHTTCKDNEGGRECVVEAKSNSVILTGKYIVDSKEELRQTCYLKFSNYHSDISLITIDLQKNELISENELNLNVGGNTTIHCVKIKKIELISPSEYEYDFIHTFSKEALGS